MCTKHFAQTGTYQHVKNHRCIKNYGSTLKGMEAQALVALLERSPEKYNVSICTIISDDDSKGRAKAQHVSNGGQLTLVIKEPSFFADPSHRKWIFACAVYKWCQHQKTKQGNKRVGCWSEILLWGMCQKKQAFNSRGVIKKAVQSAGAHLWHPWCDVAWSYNVKTKETNKEYNAPREHRIDKVNDPVTYLQLWFFIFWPICMYQTDGIL